MRPTDDAGIFPLQIARLAAERPDDTFLQDVAGPSRTHRELLDAALRWSTVVTGLGVAAGEPVLTMLPSSVECVDTWCGIANAGGIETPINPAFRGDLLRYVVEDSRARVAIVHARYVPDVGPALDAAAGIEHVIVVGAPETEARLRAAAPAAPRAIEPSEIATLLYTSGTTGRSKGVLVPWAQIDETSYGQFLPGELDGDDAIFTPYPPYHVTWKGALTSLARVGGRVVFRERFKTDEFWKDIKDFGCTTVVLLSATIYFLYRQPERPDDAETPLKNVIMVPVIPEVEDFKRRFGVRVKGLWNMTEASTQISSIDWDVSNTKACGKLREGHQARIVDDFDREVGPGEVGELIVRSDQPWQLMAGYWNKPEATVEAWRNQWLHTGDYFTYDEEGYFYFVDRKKDAIRRRGENISSQEVENAIYEHDDVLECAVVAADSEWGEEEVMAFVVLKAGRALAPSALDAFLEARLATFMRPRFIEVVPDLPKTVTEKIRKVELRERGVGPATWDRGAKQRAAA